MREPSVYRTHYLTDTDGGKLTVTVNGDGGVRLYIQEPTEDDDNEYACGCGDGYGDASIEFSPDYPADLIALRSLKEILANLMLPE